MKNKLLSILSIISSIGMPNIPSLHFINACRQNCKALTSSLHSKSLLRLGPYLSRSSRSRQFIFTRTQYLKSPTAFSSTQSRCTLFPQDLTNEKQPTRFMAHLAQTIVLSRLLTCMVRIWRI